MIQFSNPGDYETFQTSVGLEINICERIVKSGPFFQKRNTIFRLECKKMI